jgi:hypothetical protein
VTTLDTVRELLKRTPRESRCDACLAYGCSISLTDMQQITAELRISRDFTEGGYACASCGRLAATTIYHIRKCAHCSRPIGRDGLGMMFGGDEFHSLCWRRLY